MPTIHLADTNTGKFFVKSGICSSNDLNKLGNELHHKDFKLHDQCPMDSGRLRSREALLAYGVWLYVSVRIQRPLTVLETGVQNGCSTELILWALRRNGSGRLLSIDSGGTSTDGSHHTSHHQTWDGMPGRDILPQLKEHWELVVGTSEEKLPMVCQRLKEIHFFWHDSDHSDENVRFEFSTAVNFVPPNGWLCMHDFHGQSLGLAEAETSILIPNSEPLLRVWRRL